MAHMELLLALGLISAGSPGPSNDRHFTPGTGAPAGAPTTKYCMRIEAVTGTRLEETKCWTRAEWAEIGVDVDEDWAKEGVRTIG